MTSSLGVLLVLLSPPPAHQHDGAFARLQQGMGLSGIEAGEYDQPAVTTDEAAPALEMSASLGVTVSDGVVLHADLFTASQLVFDLDLFCGDDVECDPDDEVRARGFLGGGVGVTGYDESGFYATGGLGASSIRVEFQGGRVHRRSGLAMRAELGKEWWVSENWGLGAALGGRYIVADDGWSARSASLLFTATYN